jgi:hypothetical protein
MASYNGHALVTGLAPTGKVVTIDAYASVFADSVPVQHVSRLTEHIGADGTTAALQWDDSHYELSITIRPASSTAIPNLQTQAVVIPKGSVVELTGFHPVKESDGALTPVLTEFLNADDWIVVGDTSVTLNASGAMEVQLQLRRYPDSPGLDTPVP